MSENKEKSSRREFIQHLALLGTAGAAAPLFLSACGGGDAREQPAGGNATTAEAGFSCDDLSGLTDAEIQMRENAQYVDDSPHEDRRCDNCQLFVEPAGGEQCGGCQVIKGPIHPLGWCNLWVAQT